MNRRKFLRSLFAAVATVAIGLKLAESMPEAEPQRWQFISVSDDLIEWYVDYGSDDG